MHCDSHNEIFKLKKKLEKLQQESQKYLEKNKQYLEQYTKLVKKFSIQTEPFSGRYHDERKQLENFYDVIVDIDSLINITKGWEVNMTEIGKRNYEIMKEKEF